MLTVSAAYIIEPKKELLEQLEADGVEWKEMFSEPEVWIREKEPASPPIPVDTWRSERQSVVIRHFMNDLAEMLEFNREREIDFSAFLDRIVNKRQSVEESFHQWWSITRVTSINKIID